MLRLPRLPNSFFLGFGAGFLARDLLASDESFTRPLVKGVLKTSVSLLEKGRESFAHFIESVEDLLAEVQAERSEERARPKEEASEALQPDKKVQSVEPTPDTVQEA